MNKQELERYLEIETVLRLEKIEFNTQSLFACPFHEKRSECMKLYSELNGIACMNENCGHYRKVFGAFEVLQELKQCKAEEARMFGKSLLLTELQELREKLKEEEENKSSKSAQKHKAVTKRDKRFEQYWQNLKEYVQEHKRDKEYQFSLAEVRPYTNLNKATQRRYMQELLKKGFVEVTAGASNTGYYYKISQWEG